jgi:guanyl-specific ribonuclease Sa
MPLSFYSQVANEVHCAGDTAFNLTYHNSLLIGNLNPAETTVSYHLTSGDAINGVNAISNPTNFIVPQSQRNLLASQTIYARINHLGNITTNYFSLIVNADFFSVAIIDPINCYNNAIINLDIIGGAVPFVCLINGTPYTEPIFYGNNGNPTRLHIRNLVAGTYNIEVIDAIGCLTRGSYTIEPSSIIPLDTPTVAVINATCKGSNNGAININTTGGKSPFSYSLNDGVTYVPNNTFTNLAAGNYTVYVKDASDCIQTTNTSVTEPNLLQMTAAITKTIDCISNATVTLTATGGTAPYTYSKDGIAFAQSNVFNNLVAGTFTSYVKDANGCINQITIVISPLIPLNTIITKTDVNCKGNNDGSITVNANGGQAPLNYSIDNGVTYVVSNTFTNLAPGAYNIKVKDALNCTSSMTTTIVEPIPLSITAAITKTIDCINNATVTLTASGGTAPYTYSKDGITFVQSNVFDNLVSGIYTTQVKDANGCITQNSSVISPLIPLNTIITKTDVKCNGNSDGSITVNASGGQVPLYHSIDNGVTYASNNTFTGLSIGAYNVITKDALNCTSSMTTTIVEPVPLSMTAAITKTIDCINNATVTLTASGGTAPYTYSKDGITFVQSNVFDNLVAGIYTTHVKDANGCINSSNSITISPLLPLSISTTVVNVSCKGNNDASISISASGGKAPFNYSIDNGVTYVSTNTFTNLVAGPYNITVKDALNCTSSMIATLVEPAILSATAAITKTIDCLSNATIAVTASGGTAPYTHSKDGITFVQNNVFDNLVAGIYTTHVKDANGCINSSNSITISPLLPLSISTTVVKVSCKGNNDASISISASGGKAPFNYSIDNGVTYASSNVFTNLVPGTYNLIVRDASNCTSSMIATIVEPTLLSMTAAITKHFDCLSNAIVTLTATGGTAPYSYSKDGITFVQNNVFDNLAAGSHIFFTKDVNGCQIEYIQIITSPLPLIAVATATNINCKGGNTGSITITITGGNAPYSYSLDNGPYTNGNSIKVFANLYAGTHHITVKDTNGCLITTQAVASEPLSELMTVTTVKNQTITINATGGVGNYSYAISPNLNNFSTNNVFSALNPGTYTVHTKDANGCYIMMNAVVDPTAPLLNGQIKLNIEFKPGQTLADLIINGQNIKWYINQNPLAGKTSKTNEEPLPLSTVIVDGTTYYASQTINGIESIERLAVTVKSGTLGMTDLVMKDFTYYPNPVKNIFTISNTSIIDEVSLISIKGETLLTRKINSLYSEIDLSNFSKGVYFLKVKSEGTEKTVKIIKE